MLKNIGRILSVSLYDRYSKDNCLQILLIILQYKLLSEIQIFKTVFDGSFEKLYFDFFWGNLYECYLLKCSFDTSLFSLLEVFNQNAFLFFWITILFLFEDSQHFFSTASNLVRDLEGRRMRIAQIYVCILLYSQTCSNDHLYMTATCLRRPILSLPGLIPIQALLYKTTTCLTWPATTFFAPQMKKNCLKQPQPNSRQWRNGKQCIKK